MINRDDTINVAIQLRDTYDLPLRDAMSIAIESAFYMENQQTPATEGLGASLSLGARILSAVKRAIDFVIRMVRELIAKFSKNAIKKDNALKNIASGVSTDIYKSARGIFQESRAIITKCVTYAGVLETESTKMLGAVKNKRDADLNIPDGKIDPETIASASTSLKERATALTDHSKKMMERYAYKDMHIDFETSRDVNGKSRDLTILLLIPDQLATDFSSDCKMFEDKVTKIGKNIDNIYKLCENKNLIDADNRRAVEAWCAKMSKRFGFLQKALGNITSAVSAPVRVPVTT